MKRLLKKYSNHIFKIDEKVKFKSGNPAGIFTVMTYNNDLYTLLSPNNEVVNNISSMDITGEGDFVVGDEVIYEDHPYDNVKPFIVKEVLNDGTYFIENEETSYMGINGKSLKLK